MKPIAHDVARDDRVDLDAVDPARPEDQRGDEISSPSGTDHERREPVGVRPRAPRLRPRTILEVVGEGRQLVAQVLGIGQVGRDAEDGRGRRRVDVHESRFRKWSRIGRAERPVSVGALVDADARERIPLAEEHSIGLVAFRVRDVEPGDARPLARERNDEDRHADRDHARPACRRHEEDGGGDRQGRGPHHDPRAHRPDRGAAAARGIPRPPRAGRRRTPR